ncbi:MAG: exosortase system-associated protein, TIGR04073 family [Methylomonas lenta]|nr:exosortase system-associated protein, TIGR04073 family [Methylomonas lenta]
MNKNKILAACVLSGALLTVPTAQAESYMKGFSNKVSQGLANIAFGFAELPKNVINISDDQNIFVGMTWGVIRGTAQGVTRTLIGGAELLTSPIPTSDYASPAYVWDRFSEDSRYFGLHYPGYWTTYGPLDDGDDD